MLGYFVLTLPATDQLNKSQRRPSITILAADGSLLDDLRRSVRPAADLAGDVALSARGGDRDRGPPVSTAISASIRSASSRAALADLAAGHVVEGGSTITQQLAKNLFLTPERSLGRKIRESLLALWLAHRFTKNQILEIYLNRVYLGAGAYGVDAAAHRYFGKSARRIDLYESALLAGLLKAPTLFNPLRDRDKAAARTQQVLTNMVEAGFITRAAADKAAAERASLATLAPDPAGQPLFRRLGRRAAGRFRRRRRSRPDRPHHPRPAAAGRGRSGDRRHDRARRGESGGRPGRAGGDVARRRGARDGRRPQLRRQPVQSRHPGRAPAGIGLQALCLSGRPRSGAAPVRPFRRRPDPDRQLAAARLHRPLPGRHDDGASAGAIDQHDRGPGGAARRRSATSSPSPTGSGSPRH